MMPEILKHIFLWAEVWALFIPLYFIVFRPHFSTLLTPVKYYVICSFFLYVCSDIISNQKNLHINLPWHNNGLFYNLHAITKFIFFSWFFIQLKPLKYTLLKAAIFIGFLGFIVAYHVRNINSIFNFNSLLLGVEGMLLLVFCLLYYKELVSSKEGNPIEYRPDFWVVTGLSLYITVNLLIFLFYNELSKNDAGFAIDIWIVPNVFFIIMCLFFGRAFFLSYRKNHLPFEYTGV